MGNRERIISESLRLFNQHGAENVGCNKIAASLGISPGNLYYHFKNKEAIIQRLFDDIDADITGILIPIEKEHPYPPENTARNLINWTVLVWKHRFFFGGLVGLMRNDDLLRERYAACQEKNIAHLLLSFAAEAENLGKTEGAGKTKGILQKQMLAAVSANVWLIATGWIRHLQTAHKFEELSADMIGGGAFQIFACVAPFLPAARREAIAAHLNSKEFRDTIVATEKQLHEVA